MQKLPAGFRPVFVDCGEVTLHAVTNGAGDGAGLIEDPRTPIIFLHGFPEFWIAWKPVFERLSGDFLIIAPDQRGYNLSDAPQGVESYRARRLVGDLMGLAGRLLGERKFILAGHDWGASVAYAAAFGFPQRIAGLAIANGVHPVIFQRALIEDPDQIRASQYIHYLRAEGAAERMADSGYRRTFGMFDKLSPAPWLTAEMHKDYAQAWSRPGRLNAMLNWYRAAAIVVPKPGEPIPDAPLLNADAGKFAIAMPHLLMWGHADPALLKSSNSGLEKFAPRLQRVDVPGADHWITHTHGELLAGEIRRFANDVSK